MTKKICIISQKGGTGKTTTAVNLSASMALTEKKTLLIDCDPQGNATTGLGINKKKIKHDLYHVLTGKIDIQSTIHETELEYLKVIPACFDLIKAESNLTFKIDKERFLKKHVEKIENDYEYVIIDAPPSLGYLAESALIATEWLLIPVQYHVFSLEGLGNLLRIVRQNRKTINPFLKVAGILLTMYTRSDDDNGRQNGDLLKSLEGKMFSTKIPWDANLNQAANYGKPLILFDAMSSVSRSYLDLANELIGFLENH